MQVRLFRFTLCSFIGDESGEVRYSILYVFSFSLIEDIRAVSIRNCNVKLTACLCFIYVRLLIIYTSREGAAQLSVQTLSACSTSKNKSKMSCNEKCRNVWLKRCNKSTKARYAYTYLRFETPSAFINAKLISLCRRIYRKLNFMAISSRFFFAQSRLVEWQE